MVMAFSLSQAFLLRRNMGESGMAGKAWYPLSRLPWAKASSG
jgi:hypothetical protein